jgi:transcriptional regulator with GAF, ATPase, and Fis domain
VSFTVDYTPEFDSFKERLLELAQTRSVDELLKRVVSRLVERPHVAMARIWLIDRGDRCATCAQRAACADQARCLHLVASAGRSLADASADWSRLNGDFQRIPLGTGKIGQVVSTGKAIVVKDLATDSSLLVSPEWATREGLRGFNAQPILFQDEIIGVLAIFTRIPTPDQAPAWLRIFADHIAVALSNARAFEEIERLRAHLELENAYLQEEVLEAKSFGGILGQSAALDYVLRQIDVVAPTDAAVLILGESGTGKELVAREIHKRSRRREHPLIRVNCASVPGELFESEFFGHVKGAFTGALKDRAGRFEAADGGTLFLDEVGEIPHEHQSKFLRVLQEKQYERVGEERTRSADVRIVAATNRDLPRDVAEGRFREDLYYRLNVFPIEVAPLRCRKDDIPLLAAHFLDQFARRHKLPLPRLTEAHLRELQRYDWPGNVRELQNVLERSIILAQTGPLRFDLPSDGGTPFTPLSPQVEEFTLENVPILTETELRERERDNILAALNKAGWKIHGAAGAAELLGVKPTTLISRVKKLGLKKPD